jgi:hypothetical protein
MLAQQIGQTRRLDAEQQNHRGFLKALKGDVVTGTYFHVVSPLRMMWEDCQLRRNNRRSPAFVPAKLLDPVRKSQAAGAIVPGLRHRRFDSSAGLAPFFVTATRDRQPMLRLRSTGGLIRALLGDRDAECFWKRNLLTANDGNAAARLALIRRSKPEKSHGLEPN